MTSEKVMLGRRCRRLALTLAMLCCGGCFGPRFTQPDPQISPYPAPKLWAVVPFDNQSGTSLVDPARAADHVAQQLQQVEGITVVPVNRVLEAMALDNRPRIESVHDAMALMQSLEVDGLIVGTITAWDPYEPPKIGATLSLYARSVPNHGGLDTRRLTHAPTATTLPGELEYRQPVNQVSGYFDASNGSILNALEAYTDGRVPPDSAAGWRGYLLNMNLYHEFVSHELTRRLLLAEYERLYPQASSSPADESDD